MAATGTLRRTEETGLRQKDASGIRQTLHASMTTAQQLPPHMSSSSQRGPSLAPTSSDAPPSSGSRSARTLIKDVGFLSACSSIEHHRRGKSAESLTIVGRFLQVGLQATWSTHASCSSSWRSNESNKCWCLSVVVKFQVMAPLPSCHFLMMRLRCPQPMIATMRRRAGGVASPSLW